MSDTPYSVLAAGYTEVFPRASPVRSYDSFLQGQAQDAVSEFLVKICPRQAHLKQQSDSYPSISLKLAF